jgi:hypothetical protein
MARVVVALTEAQQRALNFAIKHMSEDGHAEYDRHWDAVQRQMRGEHTPAERAAIFEGVQRLLEKSK